MTSIILGIIGFAMQIAAGVAALMYNDYQMGFNFANMALILMGVSRLTAK